MDVHLTAKLVSSIFFAMSTDLEFQHGLPEIRLEPPAVGSRGSSDVAGEDGRAIELGIGDEECRTPTSEEHKIPTILSCPPAPRKRRRVVLCNRKLSEVEFFEVVGRDEVESFFRTCFERSSVTSRSVKKRRCRRE